MLPDFSPRLLNRQIKSGVYFLQQKILHALFPLLSTELDGEVKLAVAILVAYSLDLIRTASRDFAKYCTLFSSTIVVSMETVTEYETSVQAYLFSRVWASVPGRNRRGGELDTRLRNTGTSIITLSLYVIIFLVDNCF